MWLPLFGKSFYNRDGYWSLQLWLGPLTIGFSHGMFEV